MFCLDRGIINKMIERYNDRMVEPLTDERLSEIVKKMVWKKGFFGGVYTKEGGGVSDSMSFRSNWVHTQSEKHYSQNPGALNLPNEFWHPQGGQK